MVPNRDPAATVNRLFNSAHVKDLRFIIVVALFAVIFILVVGALLSLENERVQQWRDIKASLHTPKEKWIYLQVVLAALGRFLTFFVPVLAAFGGIVAWAYQTASARLGVVDLFACEISTLCGVAAVVDTAKHYVDRFYAGPVAPTGPAGHVVPAQFTSQEDYFPIFASNSHDLQTLEARVVINITAFYTYMKAVRDFLRVLASVQPKPSDLQPVSSAGPAPGSWREAARNVVYMLFLALESARKAITDLVEFDPDVAERVIVILISELEAYRFLRTQFTNEHEVRHQRIMLREAVYPPLTRSLIATVQAGGRSEDPELRTMWEPAAKLLPELKARFHTATASTVS